MTTRILALSAYHAHSHSQWLTGLQRYVPDVDWTVLTLPPRHFSWRLRGNSLSWGMLEREALEGDYDLLLATSMTDLSALRGLVPTLSRLPNVVYFHENQFAYPHSERQASSVEPQILNLYTALAADKVLFNSHYNRDTFLQGCDNLLARLPDYVPRQQVAERLADSEVLPVGIDAGSVSPASAGERLSVLWNHRWEYDKGPAQLLALVEACGASGLPVDFSIVGQQFRRQPAEFEALRQCIERSPSLGLVEYGFIADDDRYRRCLSRCDVVLSTAIHDFQGLAVLEAVAAGCVPVVPDRLCYGEWFAEQYRYEQGGSGKTAAALNMLSQRWQQKRRGALPDCRVDNLYWQSLAPLYRAKFDQVMAAHSGSDR